jgi:hypothetical protein
VRKGWTIDCGVSRDEAKEGARPSWGRDSQPAQDFCLKSPLPCSALPPALGGF